MVAVKTMVEGGKATTGPPLGPALGPLGLNLGQVIKDINVNDYCNQIRVSHGAKRLKIMGAGI